VRPVKILPLIAVALSASLFLAAGSRKPQPAPLREGHSSQPSN
jgi:hypothetical protein